MIHLIKTEIKMKSSIKVYSQRGGRLVWLTHKDQLVEHGFEPGSRFNVEFTEDKIIITSAVDGSRKVSDKKGKPVLAILGKKITEHFGWVADHATDSVAAKFDNGKITIG